jgi:hypothetical protein
MVQALLGTIGSAFSGQSRSQPAITDRHRDNSTLAIAAASNDKTAKRAAKNADKERLASLLSDPAIMGVLTLLVGIYAAEKIPWSSDAGRNRLLRGLALSGVTLTALGRAGVGDLTTLAMASVAGVAGVQGEGLLSFDGGLNLAQGSDYIKESALSGLTGGGSTILNYLKGLIE